VKPGYRAVGLHALDRFVERIPELGIVLAEHGTPHEALVDLDHRLVASDPGVADVDETAQFMDKRR